MRFGRRKPQIKIRLVRGDDGREGTEVWMDGEVIAQLQPNGLWFYAKNVTVEAVAYPALPNDAGHAANGLIG